MPNKIKFMDYTYPISDFATPSAFTIISASAAEISPQLTRENLAKIQFLTDGGLVSGIYTDKQLVSCTQSGEDVAVVLCNRYDIVIDVGPDNRITGVRYPKFADHGDTVVDKLPDGDPLDYKYVDGQFVYNPLPKPPAPPTAEDKVEEHEQLINTLLMSSASEFERGYKETTEIQMALAQLFELVAQLQAQQPA